MTRSFAPAGVILAVLAFGPIAARAATLNVPAQYATIQAGINAAVSGDTVLVADGTYTGTGNRDIDLSGKSITVASQHGPAKTIINCEGHAAADLSGNHRGFFVHSGETVVIRGFTVKNGFTRSDYTADYSGDGGGICIGYSLVTSQPSTATIQNCVLTDNTVESVSEYDDDTGEYTVIGGDGGGLYAYFSTVTLTDCVCTGNNSGSGGGVHSEHGALTLTRCALTHNTCGRGGGVTSITYTTTSITDCTLSHNNAFEGGGLYSVNHDGAMLTVTNCAITDNTMDIGSGVEVSGEGLNTPSAAVFTNCTVSGNVQQDSLGSCGGIIVGDDGFSNPLTLTNCIVSGNISNGTGQFPDLASYTATTINSSDVRGIYVRGGYMGTGNISVGPQFVDAAGGDYHLKATSPCLGAGTHDGAPATDLDGKTRQNPPAIGAYDGLPHPVTALSVTGLSPEQVDMGHSAFTLIVSGIKFHPSTVVRWNGQTLATTYVSGTLLKVSVPANLVTSSGSALVTVQTPRVATSVAAAFHIRPVVTSLSPPSVKAGSATFTLTVNGPGFTQGAYITFGDVILDTTYVSSTRLTAKILPIRTGRARRFAVRVTVPHVATSRGFGFDVTP